jgi:shikimate kinase
MKIFLLGYMASGKTTCGKLLAIKSDFKFIDLDDYIELKEGMKVKSIFETKGEIYFRKIETYYLKELKKFDQNIVISLGGGTPCYGDNLDLLLDNSEDVVIYLKASLNELVRRLLKAKSERPLLTHLKSHEALLDFVGKHLFERNNYYSQASITISTDNRTSKNIVQEIINLLF